MEPLSPWPLRRAAWSFTLQRDTGTEAALDVSATCANLLNAHRDEAAMSRTDEGKLSLSLFSFNEIKKRQKKKVTHAFCTDLQISYVQYHRVFMGRDSDAQIPADTPAPPQQSNSPVCHQLITAQYIRTTTAQRFSRCQIISLYKSSLCCGCFMCCFLPSTPTASCLVPMGSAANGLAGVQLFQTLHIMRQD